MPDPGLPEQWAARLAQNRQRLLAAEFHARAARGYRPGAGGVAGCGSTPATLGGIGLDAALRWWSRQPWRAVIPVVWQVGQAASGALAQRYPWRWVAGGAIFGGLALQMRVWRCVPVGWLARRVAPPVLAGILSEVPTGTWTALLARWASVGSKASGDHQQQDDQKNHAQAAAGPVAP
jgi:hypothetical protein